MLQMVSMLVSRYLRYVVKDQKGVTAIEYGLIAAVIAVVIVGATVTVGTQLEAVFNEIVARLAPIVPVPPPPP